MLMHGVWLFASLVAAASEWPVQSFKSSSVQPPVMNVTKNGKTEPGFIFLTITDVLRDQGFPAIYTDDGELVWHGESGHTSGFQPQTLHGNPVLTFWERTLGFGYGSIHILNQEYSEIYKVSLPDGKYNFKTALESQFPSYIDLHEDLITDRGSILVTAFNATQADLRSVGGPQDGWIHDSLFYEIDIKSNDVLFYWSALDNLAITNSATPLDGSGHNQSDPWDFAHLNSVMRFGDEYIVSLHGFCSVYAIDSTGKIKWTLNGQTGGDFKLALGTTFCFQHDVRIESQINNTVTLHMHNNDNAPFSKGTAATTGLLLDLDLDTKTVSLNRRLWDADHMVYAVSQGSYQDLANEHVLLGHGAIPQLEEYDEAGRVVMRARFGYDNLMMSYRALRAAWKGWPTTIPSAYACAAQTATGTAQVRVYASWNGATDVKSWEVHMGSKKNNLHRVAAALHNGFETEIRIVSEGTYVMVKALGSNTAQSQVVKVQASC
ncbi:hypothetical protein N7462_005057 [Penicillium macrosclerotiorum]|uniref:uncharacterized protein n=1 Tax=Penicillium macrosclerotiorum TaxID=303699 RepID=UPI0025478A33|nr:uncharacterized protein N7462_005057 [Penicillium macrosclerotiorum]KAJ5690665.1 hypothetical protein N7462_005057 [Penicillium macrosclerotiorum]